MQFRKPLLAGAALAGLSAGANAAVVAAYTDAITAMTTDIPLYAGPLVGVAALGVGFMIAIKYVKKIRGAA